MNALFGDPLVYGSAAVALAGIAVFPLTLKKYRSAPPAEDAPLPGLESSEEKEGPIPVEPVKRKEAAPLPEASDRPVTLPPEPSDKTVKMQVETPKAEVPSPKETSTRRLNPNATTTGGISPAVVYLQNLKIQMEHFEKEVQGLRTQLLGFVQKQDKESQKHDKEFLVLLKTMGDFQKEVRQQLSVTQAAVQAQAAVRPAAVAPAPAPEAEPPAPRKARVRETLASEPPAQDVFKPAPEAAPAPVSTEAAPEAAPVIEAAAPAPAASQAAPSPERPVPAAEPSASSAEDIAATLSLTLPDVVSQEPAAPEAEVAAAPEESGGITLEPAEPALSAAPEKSVPATQVPEDDPLKPPRSKGPVWPV